MARSSTPDPRGGMERAKAKDLKPLRRAAGFLKPYRLRVFLALVALTVTASTVLAIGQGLRFLIDAGFSAGDPGALDRAVLILLLLAVIMSLGTFSRFYLVTWLGERVVADIRNAVFDRILRLDPAFFEVTKIGEIMSRLTTDTTLLQSIIGSSASMALRNLLIMIGGVVMMTVTNPKLTGLVLLVVPVVVLPILILGRRVRKLSRASQDRVADVGSYAEENLNAIQTVQAYTHEDLDRANFAEEVGNAFQVALQRTRIRGVLTATGILLVFSAVGVILWVGGNDVMHGAITAGELTAFVFYATMVAFSFGIISEVYGELLRAAGATERLVELLEAESNLEISANPTPLPRPVEGRIEFDGVTFRYPSRPDEAALIDFDLTVSPGETVALVGPSGAGKSTVFHLLLRFYDPDKGRVRLDGVDLTSADPADFRAQIGLVPQDPVIFGTDVYANIRYGRTDATDAQVEAAARDAAAAEFIESLPDGYHSFLGEKGVRLSGGQRQRISISRAILRDPPILLLDEATSALDSENERLVQRALDRLMTGRTTIIIAHRLSTVMNADRIAVMDRGRIVATGTHQELLASDPLYARLAHLQFSEPGQDGLNTAAE